MWCILCSLCSLHDYTTICTRSKTSAPQPNSLSKSNSQEFVEPLRQRLQSSAAAWLRSKSVQLKWSRKKLVILGREYISYENALTTLKLERLDTRRENISLRFAIKCTQSDRHSSMFPKNPNFRPNTRHPKPFLEPWCSTSRYFNSTIPALTRLLNENSVNSNQWTSYLIQTLPTTIAIYSRQKHSV